ncbi:OR5V1 protein, partial [Crocuta crocuta]
LEMNNQTDVTEFIFLGFSNHPKLQGLFFLLFLLIYLTTLLGNMLIITATRISPALHTPMYYFLSNLSFLDICYTSTTIPVMLVNFFREKKTISYEGCLSQIFFLVICAGTEGVLLATMAYDRYVAICHPLQYPVLMHVKVCVFLVTGSWLCGLVNSVTHTMLAATLTLSMTPLEMNNQTDVTEFIFLGFSNHPKLQGLFFLLFLLIYLTTLLGNMLIITATRISPALHTPMYYFLSNLSFLDICYTSTTIPVMLVNFFREKKTISYEGCLSQIFFLVTCAGTECVLLATMAYDRYVAICHPLQYPVLMHVKVCVFLVTGSWLCGLVNSVTHTMLAATLTLCGPNQISHFLCDIPLLLKLSCSDTSLNESVLHVASATIGLSPCLFTGVSYILIISSILRIPSAQGRSKAFSTCASHLT